jgi:hypothetical protein
LHRQQHAKRKSKDFSKQKWLQTVNGIEGVRARLNKRSNDAKSTPLKRFRNSEEYRTLTKSEKQEQTDAGSNLYQHRKTIPLINRGLAKEPALIEAGGVEGGNYR